MDVISDGDGMGVSKAALLRSFGTTASGQPLVLWRVRGVSISARERPRGRQGHGGSHDRLPASVVLTLRRDLAGGSKGACVRGESLIDDEHAEPLIWNVGGQARRPAVEAAVAHGAERFDVSLAFSEFDIRK